MLSEIHTSPHCPATTLPRVWSKAICMTPLRKPFNAATHTACELRNQHPPADIVGQPQMRLVKHGFLLREIEEWDGQQVAFHTTSAQLLPSESRHLPFLSVVILARQANMMSFRVPRAPP